DVICNPYVLCFQHMLIAVAEHSRMFLEDADEDIAYTFEHNPMEVSLHDMYKKYIDAGHQKRYRMGTIAFAEKTFIPYQVADRLAFESYEYFVEKEERPTYTKLTDRDQ